MDDEPLFWIIGAVGAVCFAGAYISSQRQRRRATWTAIVNRVQEAPIRSQYGMTTQIEIHFTKQNGDKGDLVLDPGDSETRDLARAKPGDHLEKHAGDDYPRLSKAR